MKKTLVLFSLLIACVAMFAQSEPTFPYQAVVRNSQNQLIKDSTFAIDVEVYQATELKYSETQRVTTNANGQFTMNIGGGTAVSGSLTDVADWSVAKFKITCHLSGSDIVSENAVHPVPYTLQAANARERQVLSISNDTIYLTGGSYVKLPDYVLRTVMNNRIADTLNEYTLTSQICNVVNNCDFSTNAALLAVLDEMNHRLDSLNHLADSLSNLPHGNTPGGDEPTEPCTPTSSTHDIEISISELPYSFGDTTFLTGSTAGTYTLHRTNAAGCDSTITINLSLNCGTVTDVDNNEYNTVLIGEQCWMKENLRTTKTPNNENITEGMWTPGSNSVETYGRLYSWTTMMNGDSSSVANPSGVQGICPSGWHVPSDAEWKQMEMAVGMSESDANGTLFRGSIAAKLSGNTGWNSSTNDDAPGNTYAPDRNSTGFSALPAGYYRINGHNFFSQGAYFWSATARGRDDEAYGRSLQFAKAGVSRAGNEYIHGFSVRCVRNAEAGGDDPAETTLTLTTDKSSATVKLCGADSVSVTYTATVENGTATEYTWSTSGGTPTASTTNTYTVNYTTTGTYTVTCTAAGITATKSVEIASGGTAPTLGLCEDCNTGSITVMTSTNVASIVWRNGANDSVSNSTTGLTQSATIPAGNYSATAASSDGCTVTRTATLGNATSHPCTVASFRSNESGTGTQLDSVSDHEGNWYRVVEINGQCWLAENMRCTTSPRQGTVNLQPGSGTNYDNPKYYDYNSTAQVVTNSRARGLLYNWVAAMDTMYTSSTRPGGVDFPNRRGICPEGWHLPTDGEWWQLEKNTLTGLVSADSSASGSYRGTGAGKLTGGCVWSSSSNTTAPGNYSYADHNNTGFSALPVGGYSGSFSSSGNGAYFWSATSNTTSYAWYRGFYGDYEGVYRDHNPKNYGFSVRCVRDAEAGGGDEPTEPCTPTSSTHDIEISISELPYSFGDTTFLTGTTTGTYTLHRTNAAGCDSTITVNLTVNAQSATTATITFVPNGGQGTMGTKFVDRGAATTLTANQYTHNGNWQFLGWNTSADGSGTSYADQASITTDTNITLYAQWRTWCTGTPNTHINEIGTGRIDYLEDNQNNRYQVIQIGDQCWMRDNLRTTKYADSTDIEQGSTTSNSVAYWYYPNDNADNKQTCGLLYNWKAVRNGAEPFVTYPKGMQGVCPTGWHVPSKAEWTQMTDSLIAHSEYGCGNNDKIAKALASPQGWLTNQQSCNVGTDPYTNNAAGFSAIPAGSYTGSYSYFGDRAYFWTSDQNGIDKAFYRSLYSYLDTLYRGAGAAFSNAYSVRCVRDMVTPDGPETENCGTVIDQDGNTYRTVIIGEQCWMRDNLRTLTNNGYGNVYTPTSKQIYGYEAEIYGRLYNWAAVMQGADNSNNVPSGVQGICPTGWHVPSDAEWIEMIDFVKSQSEYRCDVNKDTTIAKALASTKGWYNSPNNCTVGHLPSENNAVGFSAIPAGYYSNNILYTAYDQANYATTTKTNSNNEIWCRTFGSNGSKVYHVIGSIDKYYSVRCVKN